MPRSQREIGTLPTEEQKGPPQKPERKQAIFVRNFEAPSVVGEKRDIRTPDGETHESISIGSVGNIEVLECLETGQSLPRDNRVARDLEQAESGYDMLASVFDSSTELVLKNMNIKKNIRSIKEALKQQKSALLMDIVLKGNRRNIDKQIESAIQAFVSNLLASNTDASDEKSFAHAQKTLMHAHEKMNVAIQSADETAMKRAAKELIAAEALVADIRLDLHPEANKKERAAIALQTKGAVIRRGGLLYTKGVDAVLERIQTLEEIQSTSDQENDFFTWSAAHEEWNQHRAMLPVLEKIQRMEAQSRAIDEIQKDIEKNFKRKRAAQRGVITKKSNKLQQEEFTLIDRLTEMTEQLKTLEQEINMPTDEKQQKTSALQLEGSSIKKRTKEIRLEIQKLTDEYQTLEREGVRLSVLARWDFMTREKMGPGAFDFFVDAYTKDPHTKIVLERIANAKKTDKQVKKTIQYVLAYIEKGIEAKLTKKRADQTANSTQTEEPFPFVNLRQQKSTKETPEKNLDTAPQEDVIEETNPLHAEDFNVEIEGLETKNEYPVASPEDVHAFRARLKHNQKLLIREANGEIMEYRALLEWADPTSIFIYKKSDDPNTPLAIPMKVRVTEDMIALNPPQEESEEAKKERNPREKQVAEPDIDRPLRESEKIPKDWKVSREQFDAFVNRYKYGDEIRIREPNDPNPSTWKFDSAKHETGRIHVFRLPAYRDQESEDRYPKLTPEIIGLNPPKKAKKPVKESPVEPSPEVKQESITQFLMRIKGKEIKLLQTFGHQTEGWKVFTVNPADGELTAGPAHVDLDQEQTFFVVKVTPELMKANPEDLEPARHVQDPFKESTIDRGLASAPEPTHPRTRSKRKNKPAERKSIPQQEPQPEPTLKKKGFWSWLTGK